MMMWLFGVFVLISAVTSNSEEGLFFVFCLFVALSGCHSLSFFSGLENLYTSTNGENWEDSENWVC